MIRQSIIDMVMATEMKQHFEHLAKFENNFNKRHNVHEDGQSTVSSYHSNYVIRINVVIIYKHLLSEAIWVEGL